MRYLVLAAGSLLSGCCLLVNGRCVVDDVPLAESRRQSQPYEVVREQGGDAGHVLISTKGNHVELATKTVREQQVLLLKTTLDPFVELRDGAIAGAGFRLFSMSMDPTPMSYREYRGIAVDPWDPPFRQKTPEYDDPEHYLREGWLDIREGDLLTFQMEERAISLRAISGAKEPIGEPTRGFVDSAVFAATIEELRAIAGGRISQITVRGSGVQRTWRQREDAPAAFSPSFVPNVRRFVREEVLTPTLALIQATFIAK